MPGVRSSSDRDETCEYQTKHHERCWDKKIVSKKALSPNRKHAPEYRVDFYVSVARFWPFKVAVPTPNDAATEHETQNRADGTQRA